MDVFLYYYALANALLDKTISPRDEWLGMYMLGKQIGYMHISLETTTFLGKPAYHISEMEEMWIAVDEEESHNKTTTDYYLDLNLTPIYEARVYTFAKKLASTNETKASKESFIIKYNANKAECQLTKDGKITGKSIELPSTVDFAKRWKYDLGAIKLSVGDHIQYNWIDSDNFSIEKFNCEVTGQEDITISGKSYKTIVLTQKEKMKEWLLESGEQIKYENPNNGFMRIRQSREEALNWLECSPVNFTELLTIAVKPSIPHPDQLTQLNIRIINFPFNPDKITSDSRQSAVLKDGSVEYNISASSFEPSKSVKIPVKAKEYSQYLAESAGIEVKNAAIKELARSTVGDETNAYIAASKLRAWVKENIKTGEDNLPKESAVAILAAKTGVCRHKALLYTALARAAGIPTRLVVGFTYSDDSLQGHAWAESFVGEWVPFDPTLFTDFVDATHIKLEEGIDAAVVIPVTANKLAKAEVISYKPTETPVMVSPCPPGYTVLHCPDGGIVCIPPGGTNPGCGNQ